MVCKGDIPRSACIQAAVLCADRHDRVALRKGAAEEIKKTAREKTESQGASQVLPAVVGLLARIKGALFELMLGGRRVAVKRPRARSTDGEEVALPSWEKLSSGDPLDERAVEPRPPNKNRRDRAPRRARQAGAERVSSVRVAREPRSGAGASMAG